MHCNPAHHVVFGRCWTTTMFDDSCMATCWSPWELPMNSMLHAIGPELVAPGACNEGFLCDDAMLVVAIITDEHEDPQRALVDEADRYARILV